MSAEKAVNPPGEATGIWIIQRTQMNGLDWDILVPLVTRSRNVWIHENITGKD